MIRSFFAYRPSPRYDGVAWTHARIEEAAASTGPWTPLETIALDPVDADPAFPQARSFTTEAATLQTGWYRVAFVDADGDEELTEPVGFPATLVAWAPTVAQVAEITPAYTRGGFDDDEPQAGAEQGTYTDTTTPTAAEVTSLIATACTEVQGRVGISIPPGHWDLARVTARWHVAAQIAGGKMPAGTDDASGEYRSHITNYRACLDRLVDLVQQPTALRLP